MSWSGLLYLSPYFLSALICVGIGLYAFRRRDLAGAAPFVFVALSETIWTLGFIFQQVSPGLQGKLFWNNIQFLGAIGAPLAYLAFGYDYTGRTVKVSTRNIILALSAAILVLIWTDGLDGLHHLFRTDPHLVSGFPYSKLVYANGPTFILYPFFAYILLIVGTYVLAHNYIAAPRVFRLQIATVLIGILIPWISTLITWLNLVPVTLQDITPLTFAVSNVVVAWALFRYRLFDLTPVAYDTLVRNMEDAVIVLDLHLRIADLNPAAQQVLNLPLNNALGKPFIELVPVFEKVMHDRHGFSVGTTEISIPVGDAQCNLEVRVSNIFDNRRHVNGNLVLLRDITERKLTEDKLHQLAVTDPLTGLFNRRYFFDLAEREFERSLRAAHPLAIILLDVDHFKEVNDTYGHLVGDQVLQSLVQRCLQSLRGYDVMARYGGEEFIIMLPETDANQAYLVAERLRTRVAGLPFVTQGGQAEITISLGIASIHGLADLTFDQLIDRSDQALMMVKQRGRNQVRVWGEEALRIIKPKTNPEDQ